MFENSFLNSLFLSSLVAFATVYVNLTYRESFKKKGKEKCCAEMTQGGMDKEEDWSRPAQPKSSNTQLDECAKCQQLRRRGVDRDLVVTRKATKKKIASQCELCMCTA